MSTIGSAGSVSGLYQFFQGISANNSSHATSAASTTGAAGGATSADASQSGQVSGHHHHHGGGGGSGGALFKQIQSAVTSALQTAQANGTAQDPNQVIEDAISSVLKNAGNGTSATGSNGATQSTADPDGDGDTDGSGAAEGAESAKQSFFQGLQALGVDPQQFHQDFLAAVQNAQNGNVDPSTAFASFPPGSGVDTFA